VGMIISGFCREVRGGGEGVTLTVEGDCNVIGKSCDGIRGD
jgi:hypothetical protein